MDHSCLSYLRSKFESLYSDHMIMRYVYFDSKRSQEFDETDHMWLYSSEFYDSFPRSECCYHEDILCCSHRESGGYTDICSTVVTRKVQHFASSFIDIAKCLKSLDMLIYRPFSYITPTRKWYFEFTETLEKSRKEKYSNSYLFYEFDIEIIETYLTGIKMECITRKINSNTKRLYDREKCKNISNTRYIMKSKCFKK